MIKAIFFDFYNTLAHFWPPVQEIQVGACKELGIAVSKKGILRGYGLADDYFSRENGKLPLSRRSEREREEFFARYEQLVLQGAGLDVSLGLAHSIWHLTTGVPKSFVPFGDVIPALRLLKKDGLRIGVLSNLNSDMGSLVKELGLGPYLDLYVTSRDVGVEKPHARIFLEALKRAGVSPSEAVHVGDQYHSDILGARAVGINPVFLDRDNRYPEVIDCLRVESLLEVKPLLARMGEN